MHRSIASVLVGALALPLTVVSASAAVADHRPKSKTVGVTLKTDAMPTRIDATSLSGRMTCVKVAAGSGRERRVWLTLEGRRSTKVYTRVAARESSKCLLVRRGRPARREAVDPGRGGRAGSVQPARHGRPDALSRAASAAAR